MNAPIKLAPINVCFHCGDPISESKVVIDDKRFCCQGCATVYTLLKDHHLCDFYSIKEHPGNKNVKIKKPLLSKEEINLLEEEFIIYKKENLTKVLLHIPQMHCASCIWLLEKLGDLHKGIHQCRVDFIKKTIIISYNHHKISFSELTEILTNIGYPPSLLPDDKDNATKKENKNIIIKLAVAGFCAGNSMMFSFPHYLGLNESNKEFTFLFNTLNILLSIPLLIISGRAYFISFYRWLMGGSINVQVPLALGIGALYVRSIYEVYHGISGGYFDSMAGLIFFLLLGKWLQEKTFDAIRFGEKAYRFFPLVSRVKKNGIFTAIKVIDLKAGDRVEVKTNELIPADGILLGSNAELDYSYLTGESETELKVAGEMLMGGGKNAGARFEMEVVKPFTKERLLGLWETGARSTTFQNWEARASKWFIYATLALALATFLFWNILDANLSVSNAIAVLMVACPCALALAPPFIYHTVASYFSTLGFFVRKPSDLEKLAQSKAIVFDKTGTLTISGETVIHIPEQLRKSEEFNRLRSLAAQSYHPYSKAIYFNTQSNTIEEAEKCIEFPGKGIQALINGVLCKLGTANFVGLESLYMNGKCIYYRENNGPIWIIGIENKYEEGAGKLLKDLSVKRYISIVSGDDESESSTIKRLFSTSISFLAFQKSPSEKASILRSQQKKYGSVLMIGDGINDAAALEASDFGIAITGDTHHFSPKADALLLKSKFNHLGLFIQWAEKSQRAVKETFLFSLIFNAISLSFAISGNLSPLVAAIIMPVSSTMIVIYAKWRAVYLVKRMEREPLL